MNDRPAKRLSPDTKRQSRVQLAREQATARKRLVEDGSVRVTKSVVKKPVRLRVPLLRERVIAVEDRTLPRVPAEGDFSARSVRIPLYGEVATLERRVVEAEEVAVGKDYQQAIAKIPYTERREDLEVVERDEVPT